MSRERERIVAKLEKNPVAECNKIQRKFYPELFSEFMQVADPRHNSYIEYSSKVMLATLYYKGIAGISSMQEMTRQFNDETITKNLYCFMDSDEKYYLPHGVTINEFLETKRFHFESDSCWFHSFPSNFILHQQCPA